MKVSTDGFNFVSYSPDKEISPLEVDSVSVNAYVSPDRIVMMFDGSNIELRADNPGFIMEFIDFITEAFEGIRDVRITLSFLEDNFDTAVDISQKLKGRFNTALLKLSEEPDFVTLESKVFKYWSDIAVVTKNIYITDVLRSLNPGTWYLSISLSRSALEDLFDTENVDEERLFVAMFRVLERYNDLMSGATVYNAESEDLTYTDLSHISTLDISYDLLAHLMHTGRSTIGSLRDNFNDLSLADNVELIKAFEDLRSGKAV